MSGAPNNREGLSPPPRTIYDIFDDGDDDDDDEEIYEPATEESTDMDEAEEDEEEDEFLGMCTRSAPCPISCG